MKNRLAGQPPWVLVFAALGVCSAVFHAAHVAWPSGETPAWRHGLFVLINLFFSWGLLRRPRNFALFLSALTAQQLFSHGGYLLRHLRETGEIHWISLGVVALLPVCLFLFLKNFGR